MSADIIEGFLCPMCMKDLGTVTQLQGHFEEEHSSEDKAVFQQLRGFFDKAKKRILGDKVDVELTQSGESAQRQDLGGLSGYDPSWWEDQELGQVKCHTDSFKGVRDARVSHFVVETNKLLIRLDKLLSADAPVDPKKRKAFEKAVVRWIPDSEVPACLTCARSFGLLTRRHHCRLCGGIMCDRCSEFMSSSFALKLVNPAHSFSGEGFLKRTNSNTSLNSLVGVDGEAIMRVCKTCRKLLERRNIMTEQRNTKPPIVQIYDKMKQCIDDAEEIIPDYTPMVESLGQGETVYNYRQAQILRTKLVKLYEAVDQLSKKILVLNINPDQPSNAKQVHLQKSIRMYASNFMQENLMSLQSLPTEEEYNKLRQTRAAEIQRKIAAERQAAMEAQERERVEREKLEKERLIREGLISPEEGPKLGHRRVASGGDIQKKKILGGKIALPTSQKGHSRNDSDGNVGGGWKPTEEVMKVKASDPMLQQMEIIKGYIRQAKQAHRQDEVVMLEQNLRDLQAEFVRQQRGNVESS